MALQKAGIEAFFPICLSGKRRHAGKNSRPQSVQKKLHKAKTPYIMVQKDETALKMLSEKV